MSVLKLIIDGIVICFELIILLTFYNIFMKKCQSNNITIILCSAYLVIMFISVIHYNIKPYVPIIAYILTFLVTLLFNSKFLYKLMLSTVIFILLLGFENLIGLVLVAVANCNVTYIQSNIFLYLLAAVFSKLLVYIIVKIIEFRKKSKDAYFSAKSILPLLLLLLSVCILIYFVFYTAYTLTDTRVIIPMVLAILLFIFSNVSVLYILEQQTKTELKNQKISFINSQFDNQLKHYEELYENQNQTYKIWHDMNKQLLGVSGILKTGDTDLAIEYIDKLVGSVENLVNVVNSGYPVLDSIIRLNQSIAYNNDIKFDYSVRINGELNIDKMDIAIIVGNALDNAVEACKSANIINKYISLQVSNTDKDLFIDIENSTTNNIKDTNLIPSTKNRKQKYGLGINTIKQIAGNYNGSVEIMCENNVFYISVVLEINK